MTDMYDDLAFDADWPPRVEIEREPKPCKHPKWDRQRTVDGSVCGKCGHVFDAAVSRRSRLNGKRGRNDELVVANILGGRKVGSLGMSHDVEIPGYLRVQAKKLDRWPSLGKVIEWLDAIPVGPEIRAVTLADTPGPGGKTRRLIVMGLEEFAQWHGRPKP